MSVQGDGGHWVTDISSSGFYARYFWMNNNDRSLTDYPRSRVPIIMASDRTGGGQPASHLAGDRGWGGGGWVRGCEGRLRPDHPQLPVKARPQQIIIFGVDLRAAALLQRKHASRNPLTESLEIVAF